MFSLSLLGQDEKLKLASFYDDLCSGLDKKSRGNQGYN
jgi:hypothetical protein